MQQTKCGASGPSLLALISEMKIKINIECASNSRPIYLFGCFINLKICPVKVCHIKSPLEKSVNL